MLLKLRLKEVLLRLRPKKVLLGLRVALPR
jgi:hypothetical protein